MKIKPEVYLFLVFMFTLLAVAFTVIKNKNINKGNAVTYREDIRMRLDNLLSTYDADRVVLYKFSEYDKNKTGFIKYNKINCYLESTVTGIESMCYTHQNIPTLLLMGNFKAFNSQDTLFVRRNKYAKNAGVKYLMNMLASKSLYSVLIRDEMGDAIGLLTMQYIYQEKDVKDFSALLNTSKGIRYLLLKNN